MRAPPSSKYLAALRPDRRQHRLHIIEPDIREHPAMAQEMCSSKAVGKNGKPLVLLGNATELVEFADAFEARGKKVWHQLADIPRERS